MDNRIDWLEMAIKYGISDGVKIPAQVRFRLAGMLVEAQQCHLLGKEAERDQWLDRIDRLLEDVRQKNKL